MLFGNEVDCTNALMLLIKIMLCSKKSLPEFLELKLFSYQIGGCTSAASERPLPAGRASPETPGGGCRVWDVGCGVCGVGCRV